MKKKERKKNISGRTTLHLAALSNCKEIAEVLLSYCANINEKDKYGQTALHVAAYYGSKEITEVLVSRGANINEKNKDGKTARLVAIERNYGKIVTLLTYAA